MEVTPGDEEIPTPEEVTEVDLICSGSHLGHRVIRTTQTNGRAAYTASTNRVPGWRTSRTWKDEARSPKEPISSFLLPPSISTPPAKPPSPSGATS
jgi:hypothetical protein